MVGRLALGVASGGFFAFFGNFFCRKSAKSLVSRMDSGIDGIKKKSFIFKISID